MPQFQPQYWINLLSWTYVVLVLVVTYSHLYFLPNILRIKLSRYYMI